MKTKPSDFKNHPFSSVFQNTETEVVALNVMTILWRTGDEFRDITEDEYVREREKDGHFTRQELGLFKKVIPYFKSADTAKLFSESWAD